MPRVLRPPQPFSPPRKNNDNTSSLHNSANSIPSSAPQQLPTPNSDPSAQPQPLKPLENNTGVSENPKGASGLLTSASALSPPLINDGRRRNHSFSGISFDDSTLRSFDRRFSNNSGIPPPSSSVSSPGSTPLPRLSLPSIGVSFPAFSNDITPPSGRRHSITDPSFHVQRRLRPLEPSLLAQSQKVQGMQDSALLGRRGTVLDLAAAAAHAMSNTPSQKYIGPSPLKRKSSFDEISLNGSTSSDYPSKRRESQNSTLSDDRISPSISQLYRMQYDADQRRFSYPASSSPRANVAQSQQNPDSLKSLALLSELASASEASADHKAAHQSGRRASMSNVNIATHSDNRQPFPVPPPGTSGNSTGGYYQDPFSRGRGDTPYSRGPELRVSHKLAERKRRKEMKELFEELRDALPVDKTLKTSKWEILSKAVDYINDLKSNQNTIRTEVEQLRQQVAVLKQGRRMST